MGELYTVSVWLVTLTLCSVKTVTLCFRNKPSSTVNQISLICVAVVLFSFLSDEALDMCRFYLLVFFEGGLGSTEVYLQLFPPVLLLSQTSLQQSQSLLAAVP